METVEFVRNLKEGSLGRRRCVRGDNTSNETTPLKLSGYCKYQQVWHSKILRSAHTLYVRDLYVSQKEE